MSTPDLIIAGASARAAAFSAARAGFQPYWIDQYGDFDLRGRFPGAAVSADRYPAGMLDLLRAAPQAPFLYTGALENHPGFLERAAMLRPLLGNGREVCERVRDPRRLRDCLQAGGIDSPRVVATVTEPVPAGRWLLKSMRSAGGLEVAEYIQGSAMPRGHYVQEYVRGESRSGVYIGNGVDAVLLGVTQQLVGVPEFHAGPYMYCGSIGPLRLAPDERRQWQRAGIVLAREFGLRGVFGIDALLRDGIVVPVEVNPRYTASVEVIEQALGIPVLRYHCTAVGGVLPPEVVERRLVPVGKAYLFAPQSLQVDEPEALLEFRGAGLLQLADIPMPGSRIARGAPILTLLVTAVADNECRNLLLQRAAEVYARLGGPELREPD